MKILTNWLRHYLPTLPVTDRQLADDLTLRGIAVEGVHALGPNNGHLFEMDITTNRVDAMNHYGIAREAATIYNLPLVSLGKDASSRPEPKAEWRDPRISSVAPQTSAAPTFPIPIEAKALCGRFTAQVLRNVTIAPSTGQIAEYFTLLDQKQISNAVDASNFVLLGMGHPTHAFDLDKLEGGIIVRLAHKGEKLKLLDGTDRTLEPDDLVVADEKKALALAGVMGGWDSMITPETKNILVEAAWFDPAAVRRSSRRHGLHTDASHRFERGADFNAAPIANALVSKLILQARRPRRRRPHRRPHPRDRRPHRHRPPINLSVQQVQRHLGTTLDARRHHLRDRPPIPHRARLHPHPKDRRHLLRPTPLLASRPRARDRPHRRDRPRLRLQPLRQHPPHRDIPSSPTPPPPKKPPSAPASSPSATANPSPAPSPPADADLFHEPHKPGGPSSRSLAGWVIERQRDHLPRTRQETTPVPMENPLSEEASLLRPSLIPGMLTMLAHNLNRDVKDVRLFEQGQIFTGTIPADGTLHRRSPRVPATLPRPHRRHHRNPPLHRQDAPFFELKGAIESLLSLFTPPGGPAALTFTAEAPAWLQPGRSATALLNNQPIAHFGELATPQLEARKLRQPVYLAQLDLARLYDLPLKRVTAHDLSRFQAVERDFSFIFPDSLQWHTIAAAIHALAIPELQSLNPIEVWRDQKKYPGVYSLLLRTVFQSHDRTLRDEELTHWSTQIIEALTQLGGTLRA